MGTLRGRGGFDRLHVNGIVCLVKRSHYFYVLSCKSSCLGLIIDPVLQVTRPQNIAVLLTDDGSHERSGLLQRGGRGCRAALLLGIGGGKCCRRTRSRSRRRLGRRMGRLRGSASYLRKCQRDHSHAHPYDDDRCSRASHDVLHSSLQTSELPATPTTLRKFHWPAAAPRKNGSGPCRQNPEPCPPDCCEFPLHWLVQTANRHPHRFPLQSARQ